MKLELSIEDRLVISSWMPHKGPLVVVTTAKDIDDKIAFSEEEQTRYKFETVNGGLHYTAVDEKPLVVEFTDDEKAMIFREMKALDQQGLITRSMLPLIKKLQTLKTVHA